MNTGKFLRIIGLIVSLSLLVFSATGCLPKFSDYDELLPSEELLEIVGEPTMTFSYDEELDCYEVYIEGIAKNISELEINNCSVSFAVYDTEGNLICVAEDYIALMGIGVSWRFAAYGLTQYEPSRVELIELSGYDW